MAPLTSLTNDILIEIFTNLPLNSIYKFRCLSKVWLSNLSHPNFIAKWFHTNNESISWIHYHTVAYYGRDYNPLQFEMAYPDFHSESMSRNQHLFAFKFLVNQKPFRGSKLCVIRSSYGLVLCFSVHPERQNRYHVCNPLTQKWVSLPSLPLAMSFDVSGVFCEYSSSFGSWFKVFRIPAFHNPSKKFDVDIFCSDLGVWETFQVSCDENVVWSPCNSSIVVILGVLFWIEGSDRMLDYNLNQHNESDGHWCSLITLPDEEFVDEGNDFDISILGESEGKVFYASIRITKREVTVSVWVLDDVNWKILHKDISVEESIVCG